ncbi:chemokine-like receptor 1 isoform X2 [Bufo gargarizans]|uniref:chemokine-like receptor 1 isoform X2 n=1 Tax=Bufo gargarizans TaxID=30331 RepID=UPI001CF1F7B4|nr:chemokine-like receptor 1 isoform X2 [Bufo gargarizans]
MENASFFPTFYYTTYNDTEVDTEEINPIILCMIYVFNIIFYSITFILGITGNGLVIWIAGFKMKKTVSTLWFLNLAIADFVCDMISPLQITELIMEGHWPFGQTMCKVVSTILFLNMSINSSFLMIMSVDRCASIWCPLWSKEHRTPKLALAISAIIWTTCFMLSSPYLAFFNIFHDSEEGISYCIPIYGADDDTDTTMTQTMTIITLVTMFLIPLSIIAICNSLIILRLRRNRSRHFSRSNRRLKVIITIVLCFFSFWFLFLIWTFLEVLNIEISRTADLIISNLVCCIIFFSSCVNPMIYVFFGRGFKKKSFKSIKFILENTFKEKDVLDIEP